MPGKQQIMPRSNELLKNINCVLSLMQRMRYRHIIKAKRLERLQILLVLVFMQQKLSQPAKGE